MEEELDAKRTVLFEVMCSPVELPVTVQCLRSLARATGQPAVTVEELWAVLLPPSSPSLPPPNEPGERVQAEEEPQLTPWTEEIERAVMGVLRSPNRLICTGFSLNVFTADLATLFGTNWLNDSVSM